MKRKQHEVGGQRSIRSFFEGSAAHQLQQDEAQALDAAVAEPAGHQHQGGRGGGSTAVVPTAVNRSAVASPFAASTISPATGPAACAVAFPGASGKHLQPGVVPEVEGLAAFEQQQPPAIPERLQPLPRRHEQQQNRVLAVQRHGQQQGAPPQDDLLAVQEQQQDVAPAQQQCCRMAAAVGSQEEQPCPIATSSECSGGNGNTAPAGGNPCGPNSENLSGNASGGPDAIGVLTAYELQRLERIQRNLEVMVAMGLGEAGIGKKPTATAAAAAAAGARRPPRRRAGAPEAAAAPAPVRRSARNRGGSGDQGAEVGPAAAAAAEAAAAAAGPTEPEVEAELRYDDSSVRRYMCAEAQGAPEPAAFACSNSDGVPESSTVTALHRLPGCLADPALARAYSVDWRPGLVVAGGKDGVVSVWGSRQLEAGQLAPGGTVPPLLSGKLHKGWVAEVQFLSTSAAATNGAGTSANTAGYIADGDVAPSSLCLLTAGNDGTVGLWDLGRAAEAGGRGGRVPQCLARAVDLHDGGIFSLHECGARLLTASKDGTVALSVLRDSGASLALLQRYQDTHEGVVKCCRWQGGGRPGNGACVFASCGNDRRLCVVDTRQAPSAGAGLAIVGAHGSAINCLRWHPAKEHLLLSASHDPALLLHDLRSTGQPLHRLVGHAQGDRISSIYQPSFVAQGQAVATGCERSQLLSMYCSTSGTAISRGDAGITPGASFCRGGKLGDPLLVTASRAVCMFVPAWGASTAAAEVAAG